MSTAMATTTRPKHYFILKLRVAKDGPVVARYEFPVKAKREVAEQAAVKKQAEAEKHGFLAIVSEVVSYR